MVLIILFCRMPNNTLKQNGRKIFGMHDKSDQVRKKVSHLHGSSHPILTRPCLFFHVSCY